MKKKPRCTRGVYETNLIIPDFIRMNTPGVYFVIDRRATCGRAAMVPFINN